MGTSWHPTWTSGKCDQLTLLDPGIIPGHISLIYVTFSAFDYAGNGSEMYTIRVAFLTYSIDEKWFTEKFCTFATKNTGLKV